jgi:hypothetical protein
MAELQHLHAAFPASQNLQVLTGREGRPLTTGCPLMSRSVFRRRLCGLCLHSLLAVAAVVAPASAQVTIWSPFNVPTAVDQGVRKDADVAYADGERKKLDIYRPEKMTGRRRW